MKRVLQQTIDEGYTTFKFKVGSDLQADKERLAAVRELLGYDKGYQIMIDANQVWSVPEAIGWMKELAEFKNGAICKSTHAPLMSAAPVQGGGRGVLVFC